jgi:succinate-acetate transporter protein
MPDIDLWVGLRADRNTKNITIMKYIARYAVNGGTATRFTLQGNDLKKLAQRVRNIALNESAPGTGGAFGVIDAATGDYLILAEILTDHTIRYAIR